MITLARGGTLVEYSVPSLYRRCAVPIYVGAIHKRLTNDAGAKPWVNTYHMDTVDETTALAALNVQSAREQLVHWSTVNFYKLTVRQDSPLASSGQQLAINTFGLRGVTDEHFLPMFCTVRVTLSDGVGRPDQKYLRLPIFEGEQNNGVLDAGLITMIEDDYIEGLLADPLFCSSSGQPYTAAAVVANVQMRQRDWHRRERVGFKRGWVPV